MLFGFIFLLSPHIFCYQLSDVQFDETKRKTNQDIFLIRVIIGVFVRLNDACIRHTKSLQIQQHNNMTLIWCLLEQNNCKLIIMTHDYLTIQFYCFLREICLYLNQKLLSQLKSYIYCITETFPLFKTHDFVQIEGIKF